ncbi:MAG: hypothetical protein ACYC8T_19615 [Myxococcaceae bacterium]
MSERPAARLFALALALLAPAAALAQPEAKAAWPAVPKTSLLLLVDPAMSMEPGVRTLESLTPLLFAYDAELSARLAFDESTTTRRALGALGRLSKGVLLDVPLVQLEDTLVHEVFGHGARAREFGQRPLYDFRLPFPYRFLAGASTYSGLTYLARTGRMDTDVPITAAGLEANYFQAWWTQARVLRGGGQAHYADLLRYVNEKASYLPRWASDLSQTPQGGDTSDPDAYLNQLQRRFNRYTPESRAETARALGRAYLWNAADPTLWLAVYHLLVSYGWRGERVATLPRFHFGETWAYPGTRFNLSPFGAEHYLDLFAGRGERMVSAYLRLGSSSLASYAGGGLRALGFEVYPGVLLGGEFDLWRQPELLFEYRDAFDGRTLLGGGAALHAEVRVWGRLGVVGKLALKSRGYLMGQPLAAGPYGYLGLSLALDAPQAPGAN